MPGIAVVEAPTSERTTATPSVAVAEGLRVPLTTGVSQAPGATVRVRNLLSIESAA